MMRFMAVLMALFVCVRTGSADVFEDLAKYEYGSDPNVAEQAEKLLQDTPVAEHGAIENKLIAVVASKDATSAGKQFACRMLQQIGTEKCIPAVASVLNDEVLSHYARLVLERMPTSAKAGTALRAALMAAPDKVKGGIAGSLAERGDRQAVAALAKLAASKDAAVAKASILALGKIGGKDAAAALKGLNVPAALKATLAEALILCAGSLSASDAAAIYASLYDSDHLEAQRAAALGGLLKADEKKAIPIITGLIKGETCRLRGAALRMVVMDKCAALTTAVTGMLGELAPETQVLAIGCLGQRGDLAAAGPIRSYLNSEDKEVAKAALVALGYLNDADSIKDLLANKGNIDARLVESTIARMHGDDLNDRLAALIGDKELGVRAIRILAQRGYAGASSRLMAMTRSGDGAARGAAWEGLAELGTVADVDQLMAGLVKVTDESERKAAVKTIKAISSRAADKNKCFDSVAKHYPAANDDIKQIVIELAPSAGGDGALELVRAALKSGNKDLSGKAVRALAAWPNAAAMGDLRALSKTAEGETERILALRGYITRIDACCGSMPVPKRLEMFDAAAGMAGRPDEKRLVVSGLRNVKHIDAFRALTKYRADSSVKAEAELAVADLAYDLRGGKDAEEIIPVLIELGDSSQSRAVKDKVRRTLGQLYGNRSYIKKWLGAGPYKEQGQGMSELFNKAFPPEPGASGDVKWKEVRNGIGADVINLEQAIAPGDNCCAYVKTTVTVPEAQTVRLEMGSDDSIKAWVNDKLVHQTLASRGHSPAQDSVKVKLNKGENSVLLKVVDGSAHWAFSCRILDEKGMPVKGMTAAAR
jgi:HEAT repeat protein